MNDQPSHPTPNDPGGYRDFADIPPNPYQYPPPSWPAATQTLQSAVPQRSAQRGRAGFAAAVLAGALVVGGGAGIGSAAAYSALQGNSGSAQTSSGSATSSPVVSLPDADAPQGSVEQVAAAVLPSVVKLDVAGAQERGSGSGIILNSDGLILTNNHVASVAGDGGRIVVSFSDGSHAAASIVGVDPLTDTALVQAEDVSGLTPATIGDSGKVDVGEDVVAIGSPFGLDATVTAGIVSALNRPVDVGSDSEGNATVYPAIQTDAAINPGNSGGPLVDLNGHVIGINSSIQSTGSSTGGEAGSIGLGFAIPINEVLPVIEQMKNGETPTHARLGISVGNVASDPTGALVTDGAQVQEIGNGSAAGEAGLKAGDVITKIDDTIITGSDSLIATVRSYRPGDEVRVTYERDGQERTTSLTLDSDADTTNG
ncbi:S1C family serine protease [Nocardioides sp. R-C-SC26]|uniref:S1C family serine protease n=1 Tax=Nocardioides sp. R-C-SC26 TaxID=2870414 RepID=UPI001E2FC8ED|nr:trypsin-like peptidase domain-containing protein [Nocardioides sp. R-C-SC26]